MALGRVALLVLAIGLASPAHASISLQRLTPDIPYLVGIEHAGDGSGRLFLVRQDGLILIYDGANVLPTPFLDISGLVMLGSEQGLLGLAFHPSYSSNGFFYVDYIDLSGNTAIARYQVSADPNLADPNSATIVITQQQPFSNHNGGQIRFGPDGFFYVALGDGGSGGDPQDNGQNLTTLLGKLLRIDVDSAAPYAIPPTNPFVNTPGARGEIWAYGLRNPWRFSFDRQTGDLWIGDVGQSLWEEVDLQAAGVGGANYGWRLMEGLHCNNPATNCNPGSLTLPVIEYSHELGCAITGGFRYRGSNLSGALGAYVFADLCGGRLWFAAPDNGVWRATEVSHSGLTVSTFGEDEDGDIYLASYADDGAVYRLVSDATIRPTLTVTRAGLGTGRITGSPLGVECGSICAAQVADGTVVTLTAAPNLGLTFVGWSGNSDCADGVVTLSADLTCTATFGTVFTDDPLVAGTSPVKAVHIIELRAHIDALRSDASLATFHWTDPVLTAGSTLVLAVHVTEMREALDEVYHAYLIPGPPYTDPALADGAVVKAVHLSELRQAVLMLE